MSELSAQFRHWSDTLCRILELEGMLVRPYQLPTLPFFQALTVSEQREVLQLLQNYCAVCQNVREYGASLREGKIIITKALEHFNLQVDPQIYDFIGPRNVFEFYTANQTQFFRTANFFEYTSYTVEDLYSRSWMNLYERDDGITQKVLGFAEQILSGFTKGLIIPALPEHVMRERASLEKLKMKVRFECLAPLTHLGKTVGIVSVVKSAGSFLD